MATVTEGARRTVDRAWFASWLVLPVLGVVNGVLRERLLRDRVGERTAHQISTGTLIAAMAGATWAIERRWPLTDRADAAGIGVAWAAMTVGFEFGFGHYVVRQSWSELLEDYDLRHGRLWALVPTAAAAPSVGYLLGRRDR